MFKVSIKVLKFEAATVWVREKRVWAVRIFMVWALRLFGFKSLGIWVFKGLGPFSY